MVDLIGNLTQSDLRVGLESIRSASLKAELFVILHGLRKAWNDGFRFVQCESDSQLALNLILHNGNASHPYNALISLIRNCINQPWNVTFMHTLREGNACADWLAKHGATHEDNLTIWHACSPQLDTLVLADRIGVVHFKT
ncbi:hypothetical protein JHK87_000738 [Glycine soja]|nr:hypothetical protein JHK87_000738 [Glycine soja]